MSSHFSILLPLAALVTILLCGISSSNNFAAAQSSNRPQTTQRIESLATVVVARSNGSIDTSVIDYSKMAQPLRLPNAISSPFGPRWQAAQTRYDMHRGIDYFDARGTPILAVQDGEVFQVHTEAAGTMSGGGNVVILKHTNFVKPGRQLQFHDRSNASTWYSYYLHLDTIDSAMTEGAQVTKSQQLGTMGDAGTTSFVHLHFEARLEGYCSLQFQVENNRVPSQTSSCNTGFDPHVHPFVFIPPAQNVTSARSMERIEPLSSSYVYSVRYNTSVLDLTLDTIETSLGTVSFNTREGWGTNANTQTALDDLININSWVSIVPGYFTSVERTHIYYDFHFKSQPTFVEVRDVFGKGIRWESTGPTLAPPVVTPAPSQDPCDTEYLLPTSSSSPSTVLNVNQINAILTEHNNARRVVSPKALSMPMLRWNQQLANFAQNYMDGCPGLVHSSSTSRRNVAGYSYIGENLAAGTSSSYGVSTGGVSSTAAWNRELTQDGWQYPNTCTGVCGHYTQVIWANTLEVGCGYRRCNNQPFRNYWSCVYGPGGNFAGQAPYAQANSTTQSRCQIEPGAPTPPPYGVSGGSSPSTPNPPSGNNNGGNNNAGGGSSGGEWDPRGGNSGALTLCLSALVALVSMLFVL